MINDFSWCFWLVKVFASSPSKNNALKKVNGDCECNFFNVWKLPWKYILHFYKNFKIWRYLFLSLVERFLSSSVLGQLPTRHLPPRTTVYSATND